MPSGSATIPARALLRLASAIVNLSNRLRPRPAPAGAYSVDLSQVRSRARARSDINDHLETLFLEALSVRPRVLVELGVRGGESTFVLERVARLCGAALVSIDLEDCSGASAYERWTFLQQDDVEAGLAWGGPPIDVLFVDTSHLYDHTRREIEAWFPHLSDRAKAFFHDTNLRRFYFRKDGTMGLAWDNERGVIRAIEEHLGASFDERRDFVDLVGGWMIKHHAKCNGFTVLEALPPVGRRDA
jgi:hypothetical protein